MIEGGPDLGAGPLADRLRRFREAFDPFRSAVVNEPRGSDVFVGALLVPPHDPTCAAGVIFFNNVGYLGMCGHGTIGVVETLRRLGRIQEGEHFIETPVGIVPVRLERDRVSLRNVPSYRTRKDVVVTVCGIGDIRGDVAWGGNWFFLTEDHGLDLVVENVEALTDLSRRIRKHLARDGVLGEDGAEIDHIELSGPAKNPRNHSRNFVLCPGGAYDRSPCGTGTSAKMACLYADGLLQPGQIWRQEGILGTHFEGSIEVTDRAVLPTITGRAHITAESHLILSARDPFRFGIRRMASVNSTSTWTLEWQEGA